MKSEVTLGDVCSEIVDCAHKTAPESSNSFGFAVGTKAIVDGRIDVSRATPVDEDTYRAWTARGTPRVGDVILCREAPVGPAAPVPASPPVCLGQRTVLLRPDSTAAAPPFLLYALRAPGTQTSLRELAEGSTVPHLNVSDLRTFRIQLPPLANQLRAACVLGTLDDKIDSNRRLAGLFEQIAQAEFRARFIDFVRVNNAVDTHDGELHRTDGRLSDLAHVVKHTVQPAETPDQPFEHFSIPAFDSGEGPALVSGSKILSGKTRLPNTDCVLLSKLNPATKRVWWPRSTARGTPVCSSEFVVLAPKPRIPNTYLYAMLSTDERFYAELLGQVSGTTGSRQRVKPAGAMSCRVTVPASGALRAWDSFARPLYEHAHRLQAERRTLIQLRDALLPKLVSGQIRVPDTVDPEEVVGPAAEELVA